jgi:hypothetical protein
MKSNYKAILTVHKVKQLSIKASKPQENQANKNKIMQQQNTIKKTGTIKQNIRAKNKHITQKKKLKITIIHQEFDIIR